MTEENKIKQTISIEVLDVLWHEGCSMKNMCMFCNERYKRYFRLKTNLGRMFICKNCAEKQNIQSTGYDDTYDSDPEW